MTYGDRAVFTVSDFNQGVAGWLARLGNVWVEGELSELVPRARIVFFCLKDERDGSVLQGWMDRDRFERLEPAPATGDRLHAYGRGELWRKRGEFRFRAFTLEQFGLGQLLKRIEELGQSWVRRGSSPRSESDRFRCSRGSSASCAERTPRPSET